MALHRDKVIRISLGSILLLAALNAFGGGYYGMSGAEGVPAEWLDGSPFQDYFIPAFILFAVVGGSSLAASIAVFARHRTGRMLAAVAGCVMLGWIGIQLGIIGYVSWLQPAVAICGFTTLLLTYFLTQPKANK